MCSASPYTYGDKPPFMPGKRPRTANSPGPLVAAVRLGPLFGDEQKLARGELALLQAVGPAESQRAVVP